ncbi:MAG TPA: hypothetical protein VM537_14605, partial [Anaerolineae bacterium]|nr:hypothetical protein [Anaerolineae bacterium]
MTPPRRRQPRIGLSLALIVLVLTLSRGTLAAGSASDPDHDLHADLTPDNTAILSNAADRTFCRDFSPRLKRMHGHWHTLERAEVPVELRDRNLIIVGRTEAEHTG